MAAVVKAALVPGSLSFLLIGLIVGLLLLYTGGPAFKWARKWLTALGLLYFVLCLSPVSDALIAALRGPYAPITERHDVRGARVVVVIGNGAVSYSVEGRSLHLLTRRSAFAVLEAERLYRMLDPAWVVTSGGIPDRSSQEKPESEVMRDALVSLGVPADRILLESQSRTTAEQVAAVARLVSQQPIKGPVVLVTTAAHARRVMSAARMHGLDAVSSIADDWQGRPRRSGWHRWVPSVDALRGSESAIYECLALVYYRVSGQGADVPD